MYLCNKNDNSEICIVSSSMESNKYKIQLNAWKEGPESGLEIIFWASKVIRIVLQLEKMAFLQYA